MIGLGQVLHIVWHDLSERQNRRQTDFLVEVRIGVAKFTIEVVKSVAEETILARLNPAMRICLLEVKLWLVRRDTVLGRPRGRLAGTKFWRPCHMSVKKKRRAHSHSSLSSPEVLLQVGEGVFHHWLVVGGLQVGRPPGRIHDELAAAA